MSWERAPGSGGGGAGVLVSDHDIVEALHLLLRDNNPAVTSFNGVVQHLQSKLGVDLSHKIDFIRYQIQLVFQSQREHHILPPQHHNDHFAPQQNPVHVPLVSHFQFQHRLQPQVVATTVAPTPAGDIEAAKDSASSGKKRRGGSGGLNKVCGVSPELQTIVGQATMPRTEIVRQLWAYIRKYNLQDPNNKRKIICNDELRVVFETDCTDMFKMNKLLTKHIISLEPTKQTAQSAKKAKTEAESETEAVNSVEIVMISDALANFFATEGRQMAQAEVLRQMWEYIKINQLEDPLNPMVILCDSKLQELFRCESISAWGIPELLSQRHLFRKTC